MAALAAATSYASDTSKRKRKRQPSSEILEPVSFATAVCIQYNVDEDAVRSAEEQAKRLEADVRQALVCMEQFIPLATPELVYSALLARQPTQAQFVMREAVRNARLVREAQNRRQAFDIVTRAQRLLSDVALISAQGVLEKVSWDAAFQYAIATRQLDESVRICNWTNSAQQDACKKFSEAAAAKIRSTYPNLMDPILEIGDRTFRNALVEAAKEAYETMQGHAEFLAEAATSAPPAASASSAASAPQDDDRVGAAILILALRHPN